MYYRLTYKSSTDRSLAGNSLLNSRKSIDIGQNASCDLRLPASKKYEPAVFATIQSMDNGWCIVRRTDFYDIKVNGTHLCVAQSLKDKDVITFADGENTTIIKFEIFKDGEYDAARGLVYGRRNASYSALLCIVLALFALGVACYTFTRSKPADIEQANLSEYNKYIYKISVDSVYLFHRIIKNGRLYEEVDSAARLENVFAGTCFLTDDGKIVTARHCIEPWIADESWNGVDTTDTMPLDIKFAIIAETNNHKNGSDEYGVKSHCIISKGNYTQSFYSTDFHMNRSRDKVLKLGTDEQPLYWRTIVPVAHRRDMELDDYAYIEKPFDLHEAKGLRAATIEDFDKFMSQNNHKVAFMGFPQTDNLTDSVNIDYGAVQPFGFNHGAFTGCIQITGFASNGNSGGPVLALTDDGIKVISIVSKTDLRSGKNFWAVPITEVTSPLNDEVEQEIVTYRR